RSTVAAASPGALGGVAAALGHPVYWAGPQPGVTYELTLTPSGNVFVRYLPAGVPVRTSKQYLFVGTLPLPNAFRQTRDVAGRPTSVRVPVGARGVAFYSRSLPTNVYLA